MKKILLILLISTYVLPQANLYWHRIDDAIKVSNAVSADSYTSIEKYNEDQYYILVKGSNIIWSWDKFKKLLGIDRSILNCYARVEDYLYAGMKEKGLFKIDMKSGRFDTLSAIEIQNIVAFSKTKFYALNADDMLVLSEDAGVSWNVVKPLEKIIHWFYDGENYIYFTTPENQLKRMDKNFENIETLYSDEAFFTFASKLIFATSETILVTGANGVIKSIDGGNTFVKMNTSEKIYPHHLYFDAGKLYMASTEKSVICSDDLGNTWYTIFNNEIRGEDTPVPFLFVGEGYIFVDFKSDLYYAWYYDPAYIHPSYDDFFPLEVGNKWLYLDDESNRYVVEITGKKEFNGKVFYEMSDGTGPFCNENGKLYEIKSDKIVLVNDFNINPGNRFTTDTNKFISDKEMLFFSRYLYCLGSVKYIGDFAETEYYSSGIGPVFYRRINGYNEHGKPIPGEYRLVSAKIISGENIVYYSEDSTPLFSLDEKRFNKLDALYLDLDITFNDLKLEDNKNQVIKNIWMEYYYVNAYDHSKTNYGSVEARNSGTPGKYQCAISLESQLIIDYYRLDMRCGINYEQDGELKTYYFFEGSYFSFEELLFMDGEFLRSTYDGIDYSYHTSVNYPNPFNPATKIDYHIPELSEVRIDVYNSIGQFMFTQSEKRQTRGEYSEYLNLSDYSSGIYYAYIYAKSLVLDRDFRNTIKMILLK